MVGCCLWIAVVLGSMTSVIGDLLKTCCATLWSACLRVSPLFSEWFNCRSGSRIYEQGGVGGGAVSKAG